MRHFHYEDWNDGSVPTDVASLAQLIVQSSHLTRSNVLPEAKERDLVHCSAGIGRTGVFILAAHCTSKFRNEAYAVEPAVFTQQLVHLRGQRQYLVQTAEQLAFAYQTYLAVSQKPFDMVWWVNPKPGRYAGIGCNVDGATNIRCHRCTRKARGRGRLSARHSYMPFCTADCLDSYAMAELYQ